MWDGYGANGPVLMLRSQRQALEREFRSTVPPPSVEDAPYRLRPAPICFRTVAEAEDVLCALDSFFREVAQDAGCAERLPCWNKDGTSLASDEVQKAGYHIAHIAACDLSDVSVEAYCGLSSDPSLCLQLHRDVGKSRHRQLLTPRGADRPPVKDALPARLAAQRAARGDQGWKRAAVPRLDHRATASWQWPRDVPLNKATLSRGVTFDEIVSASSVEAVAEVRTEAEEIMARPEVAGWKGWGGRIGPFCRSGAKAPKTGLHDALVSDPSFQDWPTLEQRAADVQRDERKPRSRSAPAPTADPLPDRQRRRP
jgi:hypothetical protein